MKVGDYVRTKYGIIGKLNIINDTIAVANWQGNYELQDITMYRVNDNKIYKSEIIKSSPNIIDLIEVGDLVTLTSKYCENEVYRVIHIFKDNNDTIIELDCFKDGTMFISKSEDIKSIVTREQFESMEYKVGE